MKQWYLSRRPLKRRLKGGLLVGVLLVNILGPFAIRGIAKPLTMTVVHTNNVTGYLFGCRT